MSIWRISASLITGLPLLCFLILLLCNVFKLGSAPRRVLTYFNYVLMALYVLARGALLILPFTTLRDLPPPILVDVPQI
jgi:predicted neutral ceramidase superfamily lipid hydrolase